MKSHYDIIICPVITEKSTILQENENKYTFKVDSKANKIEIKKSIEGLFDVDVVSINTTNVRGKKRRVRYRKEGFTSSWKKAVVTLKEGQSINLG